METRIYGLEKRRIGSDFCDYCEHEFKAGSEKERKGNLITIQPGWILHSKFQSTQQSQQIWSIGKGNTNW